MQMMTWWQKTWPVREGSQGMIKPLCNPTVRVKMARTVVASISVQWDFCGVIFGKVMANKSHGGECRTVAIRPFSTVFRCCVNFGGWYRTIAKKESNYF